jgi:hypothetical protein
MMLHCVKVRRLAQQMQGQQAHTAGVLQRVRQQQAAPRRRRSSVTHGAAGCGTTDADLLAAGTEISQLLGCPRVGATNLLQCGEDKCEQQAEPSLSL